jgi:hypothetical protein
MLQPLLLLLLAKLQHLKFPNLKSIFISFMLFIPGCLTKVFASDTPPTYFSSTLINSLYYLLLIILKKSDLPFNALQISILISTLVHIRNYIQIEILMHI